MAAGVVVVIWRCRPRPRGGGRGGSSGGGSGGSSSISGDGGDARGAGGGGDDGGGADGGVAAAIRKARNWLIIVIGSPSCSAGIDLGRTVLDGSART
ncbi:MAG TPA: hypothetical protein VFH80_21590 [Solirubrobacteraceae bacterium]|nr:hypothetical protein [Solirubrobacteraceae bacterium]